MPSAFNFAASPFDSLDHEERQMVRDHLDIAYFRAGDVVLQPGVKPTHLFVLIKGQVQQFDGEEAGPTYGTDDVFDGRALVAGKVSSRFVASEEVLAYQLAAGTVADLISRNATFGALLFADLSKKLSTLAARGSHHEMSSLSLARVSQAAVRPVQTVEASTDIVSVVRVFAEARTDHVLVRDSTVEPARLGIFTTTGLQRAILHGTPLAELAVGQLATFKLVTVAPEDYLFDAQAVMIRHKVRRVVVATAGKDGGLAIQGTLDQLDLLSFLSNHSYLITRQILEATDLAGLKTAAAQITGLIRLLHQGGTPVGLIARVVQELNAQLFDRAWRLIAPAELVASSCLFVMGSEGRGEQLLKTDQDNALIWRDDYEPPDDLAAICQRFSDTLTDFGYPECPGRIMLSNPVCGDAHLLEDVRAEVYKLVGDNDVLMARFAAAINAFDTGQGWWNRLLTLGDERQRLDLKKAGTFPLVHGIRALALAHRIAATGTVARITALAAEQGGVGGCDQGTRPARAGRGRRPPHRRGHAPVAAFHRRAAAGGLLPRIRRGAHQPRHLPHAGRGPAPAQGGDLGDVLRPAATYPARPRRGERRHHGRAGLHQAAPAAGGLSPAGGCSSGG
jgi:CBS domain-containing protein